MSNQHIIVRSPDYRSSDCIAPEIGKLLTAYCFGHTSERDRRLVESHLLECECCWREAPRLEAAVRVLDTDRTLAQSLTPADVAAAFGISGKLDLLFGGHRWHALLACALYAALYAIALLVEVAYQFDRYGRAAIMVAIAAAGWIFVTSLAGLAADWKLTSRGGNKGLAAAAGIFLLAAAILFAGSCLFLPAEPVTQSVRQAYTAQAAYLKTIGYFIFLTFVFLLLPFHFVLVMQRELRAGWHRNAFGLLIGSKMSVAPRGVFFLRFWLLVLLFALILGISVFLHHNLMDHLKPAPYMNLFSNLILVRLILYYAMAGECLAWYYRSLNELKRESLIAERVWPDGRKGSPG